MSLGISKLNKLVHALEPTCEAYFKKTVEEYIKTSGLREVSDALKAQANKTGKVQTGSYGGTFIIQNPDQ